MLGTPLYIAPEVISKKDYGQAADWWALGVLAYELYFGVHPFTNTVYITQTNLFNNILNQ